MKRPLGPDCKVAAMVHDGFDYFVIRVSRSAAHPELVVGLVERLGSGEKRMFDTAEHLAALVAEWTEKGRDDGPVSDPAKGTTNHA